LLKPKAEENLRQSPGRGKKGYQKSDKVLEPINTTAEAAKYAGVSVDLVNLLDEVTSLRYAHAREGQGTAAVYVEAE
jgi:hypothetical protein